MQTWQFWTLIGVIVFFGVGILSVLIDLDSTIGNIAGDLQKWKRGM